MRVLFATGIYPPDIGGPATYVSQLAGALRARGGEAEVVTYGAADEVSLEDGVPVARVRRSIPLPVRYLRFARAVSARASSADLVYLQDAMSSGIPGMLAARLRGRPALLKIVGDPSWEIAREKGLVTDDFDAYQNRKYSMGVESMRRAKNLVARAADRVVVPSEFLARVVVGWGVPRSRIDVVRNAIRDDDLPRVSRKDARRELGVDARTTILSVGRLVPWKGFDALIRLAAEMGGELHWILAGSGPWEGHLRALAASSGVEERVTFTGALTRREVRLYLTASDLFVLWTGYEGLSHVLLEAMRAGVAVVASDAGGNPEIVEDGVTGRLVPWKNTERLKEVVSELCRSPVTRARLSEQGWQRAEASSWDEMVGHTLDAFERTIQQTSKEA